MRLFLLVLCLCFSACAFAHTRGLVVVIDLAEEASKNRLVYKTETAVAVKRIKRLTRGHYDSITILHRKQATKENFLAALHEQLADDSLATVDAIIYVHGKNELYETGPALCFVGDAPCTSVNDLAGMIAEMPNASQKLRALYSDACWGKSHLSAWLKAGFKVANGSRGVDSNHSLDLRRFLARWVEGASFSEATRFANKALLTRLTDEIIGDADSIKDLEGLGSLTIDSHL